MAHPGRFMQTVSPELFLNPYNKPNTHLFLLWLYQNNKQIKINKHKQLIHASNPHALSSLDGNRKFLKLSPSFPCNNFITSPPGKTQPYWLTLNIKYAIVLFLLPSWQPQAYPSLILAHLERYLITQPLIYLKMTEFHALPFLDIKLHFLNSNTHSKLS